MLSRIFGIGELDREAFARLLCKRGVSAGVFSEPELDVEAFTIRDGEHLLHLGNYYAMFRRSGRYEREAMLALSIKAIAESQAAADAIPNHFDEARERLLPRLRDDIGVGLTRLRMELSAGDEAPVLISNRPEVGGLQVGIALDSETVMALVTDANLESWEVDFDTAHRVALENLEAISQDAHFESIVPGVWISPWEFDGYASSRVLLPHILHRVVSHPIIGIPTRDVLALAQPRDDAALSGLLEVTRLAKEEGNHPLTQRLYQLGERGLEPFDFPPEHPGYEDYQRRLALEQATGYEEQKPMLQELLGEELFVASQMLFEREDGQLSSRAVWTSGVPSYLPEADTVIFVLTDEEGEAPTAVYEAPWAAAEALLEATPYQPRRWRTGDFPSLETLESIGQRLEGDAA